MSRIVQGHGEVRRIDSDVILVNGEDKIELEAQTTPSLDSHLFILTEVQVVDLIDDLKDTLHLFRAKRETK